MSIYDNSIIFICFCFAIVVIGFIVVSFLNLVVWCIVHETSWKRGCKRCAKCGHEFLAWDYISLDGIIVRGICSDCKANISVQFRFCRLIFAVLAVLCVLQCDLTLICLRNLILLSMLYVIALVDLSCYKIPDGCLLVALLAWVGMILFAIESYGGISGIIASIFSAIVYGGGLLLFSLFMDQVLQKESMGGGDIKLFFIVGLYLGILGALFAMFLACILGLCFAWVFRKKESMQIPFGPSIAIAFWTILLYGQPLIDWYMGLMHI